jgi:hypothetical protein
MALADVGGLKCRYHCFDEDVFGRIDGLMDLSYLGFLLLTVLRFLLC